MRIIALIPARSGSKSLPHKNIKLYNEIPLLAHSIIQAQKSKFINNNDIFVSTDSKIYANIASEYGANVPFLRPTSISQDDSTDFEFLHHFLSSINIEPKPDIIVQLRPTFPNRDITQIDNAIQSFLNHYQNFDSLRSVIPMDKTAFKMYSIFNDRLLPFSNISVEYDEPHNLGRQQLGTTYLHNGYIDIIKSDTILKLNSTSGNNILPFVMNENEDDDIDNIQDWNKSLSKLN